MISEHETFKNAPIEEAVIDLHVRRGPGDASDTLMAFVRAISADYPTAQKRMELSFVVGPDGKPVPAPTPPSWLLRSQDSRWVVLPRLGALAVSHVRPYTSWAQLEARARATWDRYVDLTRPAAVTRIATRFINRIVLPAGPMNWDDWFTTGLRLGEGIPGEVGDLEIRTTLRSPEGSTAAVVIKREPPDPLGRTPVFFDIDAAFVGAFEPDAAAIWSQLAALRHFKNAIFFRSLTERTREMFR